RLGGRRPERRRAAEQSLPPGVGRRIVRDTRRREQLGTVGEEVGRRVAHEVVDERAAPKSSVCRGPAFTAAASCAPWRRRTAGPPATGDAGSAPAGPRAPAGIPAPR